MSTTPENETQERFEIKPGEKTAEEIPQSIVNRVPPEVLLPCGLTAAILITFIGLFIMFFIPQYAWMLAHALAYHWTPSW